MAKRKIYLGIGGTVNKKPDFTRSWTVKTEERMQDIQAEIAELIANDFFESQDREQMEDDVELA